MRFSQCLRSVGKALYGNIFLVNDEEVISLSHAKAWVFSDSVLCLGKVESGNSMKYCLGTTVGMIQRFITIPNCGHN